MIYKNTNILYSPWGEKAHKEALPQSTPSVALPAPAPTFTELQMKQHFCLEKGPPIKLPPVTAS